MPVDEPRQECCEGNAVGSIPIPPEPLRTRRTRDVVIKKVLNGFVLGIGCETVVFEKKEHMLLELARYYDNPEGVEREYLSNSAC